MVSLIEDETNNDCVSAASIRELATKACLGKLPQARPTMSAPTDVIASQGFEALSITIAHARQAGSSPADNRDPFDRMLAAQALALDLPLISRDLALDAFGVSRIWG